MRDYKIGEIVTAQLSKMPIVITHEVHPLNSDKAIGVALRTPERRDSDDWAVKGKIMYPVRSAGGLEPFTGELTEEEEALAMMYVLVGRVDG